MGIDSAGGYNKAFACKSLCGSTNRHVWSYAVHCVRVSGLSDSSNFSVFNSDVGFVDSCVIEDDAVCNNEIQIAASSRCIYRLSHSVA